MRFFLMPLLDGWTYVFQVPGKRTTGRANRPTHHRTADGRVPCQPGVEESQSPTNLVWILGLISCTAPA